MPEEARGQFQVIYAPVDIPGYPMERERVQQLHHVQSRQDLLARAREACGQWEDPSLTIKRIDWFGDTSEPSHRDVWSRHPGMKKWDEGWDEKFCRMIFDE